MPPRWIDGTIGYLLDTSAVNRICDGAAAADRWWPLYVTDLVLLELSRTRDAARHEALFAVLRRLLGRGGILRGEPPAADDYAGSDDFDMPWEIPTLSMGRVSPLITRTIGSNFQAHWRDGFIAEVAMRHNLTLVTADRRQAKAAGMFGVSVEYIN
jgi:predicted nucleic acid-binding protein